MKSKLTHSQEKMCGHLAEEETKSWMPYLKKAKDLNQISETTDKTPARFVKYKNGKKYEVDLTQHDNLNYDNVKNNLRSIFEHNLIKE